MRIRLPMALAALAVLALGLIAPGAGAQEPPQPAGTESLLNFEHVWNFQTTGTPPDGHATDLEFYTPTVPLRDRDTGQKVLDANGNEILVERDFAVMGSYPASGGGAWIFDITDPEDPFFVVNIPCIQSQNDVQIKRFGDRWILALAKDGGGNPCVTSQLFGQAGAAGIAVFDISDPYEYQEMYSFRTTGGAHNFTFHPTKPFGYVSTGDLPGLMNHIPIIDFTDLEAPTLAADPAVEGGPHDIAFSRDGTRAYVASENNHRIYDTTDPANPALLSRTPNNGSYAHGLDPTPQMDLAIGTNESLVLGGFLVGGTAVCPGEGLTIYDIAGDNETHPVPVGEFLAPVVGNPNSSRACTGHVGEIAPNGRVMMMGWYAGGARVIDFSNPSAPREIGHAVMSDSEVWTANFYKGPYMYTADQRRGFDVFKWTGGPVAPWEKDFVPTPTELTGVSAGGGAGTVDISGTASFGGQAPVQIAEDSVGDGPVNPDRAHEDGVDLTAASIYQPNPDDPTLVFEWDVTNLPAGGRPEAVRYTFPFRIGNKSFQPQAKLTNVASITMLDDPAGHARLPGDHFQLRGNCVPNYPVEQSPLANCPHVAWLDGQFDPANNTIRLYMPIGAAFAPEVVPGARLDREVVATTTIVAAYQAVVSNADTSDEALWEEGKSYTVPQKQVSLGVAPAGTPPDQVAFTEPAALDEGDAFSGSVDTSGLGPGAYEVFVRACFGSNCDVATVPLTI